LHTQCRVKMELDGTRAETRFGLPAKWTSPFISAGVSVRSSTGFLGVRVGRDWLATHSIRLFPLHFSSRASPCATRFRFHSTTYYLRQATGCGRKNTPIWEGHSFGWGAHTMVGSKSSNSGVRAVFSVHHGVVGRTSSLYC